VPAGVPGWLTYPLRGLRARGVAVVLLSSELDELRAERPGGGAPARGGGGRGRDGRGERRDATLGGWMVGG